MCLLKILNNHGLNVPKDSRTLLRTQRQVKVEDVSPVKYSHIGLQRGMVACLEQLPTDVIIPSEINININVDGLPLSKTSSSQFWPTLAWITKDTFSNSEYVFKPFAIGIYHGNSKPKLSNDLLKYFVNEYSELKKAGGFIFKNKLINVKINCVVCDAPAKALVLCIKGHTGYHGCSKCIQEGDFIDNRMTFPEINSSLRTDHSFSQKTDEDHHTGRFILENIDI